jgi:3-hydroxyacyl-[acyl-carrier-protein] dehydratase
VTRPAAISLAWGPAQIERLLPHREPMLLVDRLDRFVPGPRPRLRAGLSIDGSEPVLRAHFPGQPIWPGAYLLEGLAQAAGLLLGLDWMFATQGAEGIRSFAGASASDTQAPVLSGLLARAEVSFLGPVQPPAALVYELRRRGGADQIQRVDGRVEVDGETVAEGSLVIALARRVGVQDDVG